VGSTPRIENNIIFHNQAAYGPGIFCWSNVKPIIINNTIVNNIASSNGGGIFCTEVSNPILINNVIYGNSATTGYQVFIDDNLSDPNFLNCDIQGGKEGFGGSGAGANYTGLYENNIDASPSFSNEVLDDYRLSDSSRCIGAGTDSVEIAGVWYRVPTTCFHGSPRPNPAGSHPDIGACENPRANPLSAVSEQHIGLAMSFALEQNYPNPFNPATVIRYTIAGSRENGVGSKEVKLVVYDLLGREVATLVNERKAPGSYSVMFDAGGLASGAYFYRLKAGDPSLRSGQVFTQTRRLMVVK